MSACEREMDGQKLYYVDACEVVSGSDEAACWRAMLGADMPTLPSLCTLTPLRPPHSVHRLLPLLQAKGATQSPQVVAAR